MTSDWRNDLPDGDGVVVLRDEPMALHTTYKVGGAAAAFVKLKSLEALSQTIDCLAQKNIPYVVVGNGSNVLFSDTTFSGAVLQLSKGFDGIEIHDASILRVGAAVSINKLVRYTKQKNVSGVELRVFFLILRSWPMPARPPQASMSNPALTRRWLSSVLIHSKTPSSSSLKSEISVRSEYSTPIFLH